MQAERSALSHRVDERPVHDDAAATERIEIRYHDVRKALPFADKTFDAAYALHIVEHLTPAEAASLVSELYRVLKPGSIVRISTPDLEDICRSYLRQLDACRANPSELNMVRYRWAVMELLDQLVREQPGGMMTQACVVGDFDPEFARRRFRDVFDEFAPSASTSTRHAMARKARDDHMGVGRGERAVAGLQAIDSRLQRLLMQAFKRTARNGRA